MHRCPHRIYSHQVIHFRNNNVQAWSEENQVWWYFYLPYNTIGVELIEKKKNGFLKQQLKTLSVDWIPMWVEKALPETIWLLYENPSTRDGLSPNELFVGVAPTIKMAMITDVECMSELDSKTLLLKMLQCCEYRWTRNKAGSKLETSSFLHWLVFTVQEDVYW